MAVRERHSNPIRRDWQAAGLHEATRTLVRPLDPGIRWVLQRTYERWPGLTRYYDYVTLRARMRRALGYRPDLRNPQTYNEKLGWRILHDRDPLLPLTTDKIAVRDYVASKIGEEYLVPLLGVYERAEDIRWDELPSRFVLKASHGCNMNLIVRDKSTQDLDLAVREASAWLRQNHYERTREWAYRSIPPRLLVEELLLDEEGRLPFDFKFIVLNGRTAAIRVHQDRFGDHRVNFYDRQLQIMSIRQGDPPDPCYQLPAEVAVMAEIAEDLAEDFECARIDLYLVRGRIRFGEITHYDGSAGLRFRPDDFDSELGRLWYLPTGAQVTAAGQRWNTQHVSRAHSSRSPTNATRRRHPFAR